MGGGGGLLWLRIGEGGFWWRGLRGWRAFWVFFSFRIVLVFVLVLGVLRLCLWCCSIVDGEV